MPRALLWLRPGVRRERPAKPAARHPPRGSRGGRGLLYVFLWATAFVPSRVLARGAPPLGILAIRFLLAGGILLAMPQYCGCPSRETAGTWVGSSCLAWAENALYSA